jgi:electron transport complex protein RnfD
MEPTQAKLIVSPPPHITDSTKTSGIMLDVLIALIPACIMGVIVFGIRALWVILITVSACIVSEYICRKVMRRSNTLGDLSAIVTGVLLALNLPVTIPFWMAALGGAVAIVVVKQMFGGLGQNFVNPAIAARIVLLVSFPAQMTKWVVPFFYKTQGLDSITGATPLALMKAGDVGALPDFQTLLFGFRGGCIGEVSVIALCIGGLYLLMRRVITPIIPATFIGGVFVLTWALGQNPIYHVLSGGLFLGAIFMATDYVTSPVTRKGQVIFGLGCAAVTVLIRLYANLPEGVSYSILFMNLLTPHIDQLTRIRKPFGGVPDAN